jgi:methyl-accepting chemotaxis protein
MLPEDPLLQEKHTETLDNPSQELEDIVTAVATIARHANVLALGAAIAAARNSDHRYTGIADELKELAEWAGHSAAAVLSVIAAAGQSAMPGSCNILYAQVSAIMARFSRATLERVRAIRAGMLE